MYDKYSSFRTVLQRVCIFISFLISHLNFPSVLGTQVLNIWSSCLYTVSRLLRKRLKTKPQIRQLMIHF